MERHLAIGSLTRPAPQYAAADGAGVILCRFDEATGALTEVGEPLRLDDSSWITGAAEPDRFHVVTDCDDGAQSALATARLHRDTDRMELVAKWPASGHEGCHAVAGPDGLIAVANYGGPRDTAPDAGVTIFGAGEPQHLRHKGSGPNKARQEAAHAHCVGFSPDGRYLIVADLGIDRLVIYERTGDAVVPRPDLDIGFPPGTGPRHFLFNAEGTRLHVVSELIGAVFSFAWNDGATDLLGSEPLAHPSGAEIQPAGIVLHPDGQIVVSVRLTDELVVLSPDAKGTARISGRYPAGGTTPRDLTFSPDGRFLLVANQDSGRITVWPFEKGQPGPRPACELPVGTPMALAFV
ncbi:lactonase family protein [Pelagovum pacificum]|uniref:Lactonase family protein n=1 Tax=Pelagovum pacificum TaxID=2588711 RepID=A0A5C5GGS3_9RHOB|nr:beta-propeller fold lactonase family protein [Pelagovum pacificum]QQA43628.1 beta-propeller fold lactonase family protein [Pelagovum pacificum]TNY33237.1 lactonase family protein [Pelagovum pacificum]